jgi:flagellar secretion chaperone FliS
MGPGEAYLEARVLSAEPLELVCLLYQHAIDAVRDARRHMASGEIALRAQAISKTLGILGELNGSLDHNAGGDISSNLEQLYTYMTIRLTEANLRKEEAPLAEVERLLATLAEAWKETRARQSESIQASANLPSATWQESGEACVGHGWSA